MNQQVNETQAAVEKISGAQVDKAVRDCREMEVGQVAHQGDVYVHRVADDYPKGEGFGRTTHVDGGVQVAVGTTVGARHIAIGEIKVFTGEELPSYFTKDAQQFVDQILGPVIEARKAWTLKHPTHANFKFGAGTYQVTYQLDMRTRQRVLD